MYIHESVLRQLMLRLEEADKFISGAVALDKIRNAQSTIFFELGLKNKELMSQGTKLYNSLVPKMKAELVDVYAKFRAGTTGYSEALASWKDVTNRYYREFYKAGAMSVGNPFYRDMDLTKNDKSFIAGATGVERKYFSKFLMDVENPNFKGKIPFERRLGFYVNSADSQFFNGQVAGAGDQVEIYWDLGPNDNHCEDCVLLSMKTYTYATLLTTPRAGSTECKFNCRCNLRFTKKGASLADDTHIVQKLAQPDDIVDVTDIVTKARMTGALVNVVSDLFAQMNKVRQEIFLEIDPIIKRELIAARKEINQKIIDLMAAKGIRVTPGISVSELLNAAEEAQRFGGELLYDTTALGIKDEIVLLRGNHVFRGVVADIKILLTSKGKLFLDDKTDIVFLMRKAKRT